MKNLLDIRTDVVKATGHDELVVDAHGGDYSDNGMDRFINAAQRRLDTKLRTIHGNFRFPTRLAVGAFAVAMPLSRTTRTVWLVDSDGNRTELAPKTIEWMRTQYAEDFSQVDTGAPLYYAPSVIQGGVRGQKLMWFSDPGLTDGDMWSVGSELTLDSGAITGEATTVISPVAPEEECWRIGEDQIAEMWETYVTVQIDAHIDAGDITMKFIGPFWIEEEPQVTCEPIDDLGAGVNYSYITQVKVPAGAVGVIFYVSEGFTGSISTIDILSAFDIKPNIYWPLLPQPEDPFFPDTSDVYHLYGADNLTGFVVMPPAEQEYTIEVWGDFYSADLVEDLDMSYWTVNHPNILTRDTIRQIEEELHQNFERAEAMERKVDEDVRAINRSFIATRLAGPPSRWVMNG